MMSDKSVYRNLPWRRYIDQFPNMFQSSDMLPFQFGRSHGCFLDAKLKDGGTIYRDPEMESLAALWAVSNHFLVIAEKLCDQTEFACNTIAVLESYKRHDDTVSDEHMRIIYSMERGNQDTQALAHGDQDLIHIVDLLQRVHDSFDGVLKGECKVAVFDRLERVVAETRSLQDEMRSQLEAKKKLPTTPHALRQRVMTELLKRLDIVIDDLAPLNCAVIKRLLPPHMALMVEKHAIRLPAARAKLRKWRDNPSQRFGTRFKELSETIDRAAVDICGLKDEVFDAARAHGARFFNRCGYVQ